MTHWDYRLISFPEPADEDGSPSTETFLEICEVYYDEHDVPRTLAEAQPSGATVSHVLADIELMHEAFAKPVLDAAMFPEFAPDRSR
jgi:hypothetical protein